MTGLSPKIWHTLVKWALAIQSLISKHHWAAFYKNPFKLGLPPNIKTRLQKPMVSGASTLKLDRCSLFLFPLAASANPVLNGTTCVLS